VALRKRAMAYNIEHYNAVKAAASSTWAFIVLPGHARACFFCGDMCSYARKEMTCEDIGDMLREQQALADTDVFHGTMRNMLQHCQQAYAQTASEQSESCGRVVACTACYNWIMHRRQTLPFITPVQILHWYLNSLSNTIPKKIDSRIISGVCHRLRGTQEQCANYYYTLFGANERTLIERISQCKNARAVDGIVARYFFESCKAAPIVLGCSVSNFLRHNLKDDDVFATNVYKAA
jgi:hypothetical protein